MGSEWRWGIFSLSFVFLGTLLLAGLFAWNNVHQTLQPDIAAAALTQQKTQASISTSPGSEMDGERGSTQAIHTRTAASDQSGQRSRQTDPILQDVPSQAISTDHQWLYPPSQEHWISWIAATVLLALMGAMFVATYLGSTLTRVAIWSKKLTQGTFSGELPEAGPLEVRQVMANLNQTTNYLKRDRRQQALTIAGISHDLRTPLARLRLEVELSAMSEQQRAFIDADLAQIDTLLTQLIERTREIQAPSKVMTDIPSLLDDIVKSYVSRLCIDTHQLTTHYGRQLFCRVNPADIRRCIVNLLENALRYGSDTEGRVKIHLDAYEQGAWLMIDVHDQGPGISSDLAERLLQPDEQHHAISTAAKSADTGTGLGFAIVRELLARHDGQLLLLTNRPTGLTVRIKLPLAS